MTKRNTFSVGAKVRVVKGPRAGNAGVVTAILHGKVRIRSTATGFFWEVDTADVELAGATANWTSFAAHSTPPESDDDDGV